MQISSTQHLATTANATPLEKGEKVAKGNVVTTPSVGVEKEALATSSNLKSVITNLLMSLAQEVKSKSAVFEMVQNAPMFKNIGNFSADFKALLTLLKSEPNVSKALLLLENFQKSMENLDGKVLKEQVHNSGVFFESKLANKVSHEAQLATVKNLVVELKEHLAQTNKSSVLGKELETIMNTLSSKEHVNPKELHRELKTILDLFRQSVKQHLSFESTPPLKMEYATVLKLEQALQNTPLVASKMQNSQNPALVEQTFTQNIKTLLTAIKESFPQIEAQRSPSAEVAFNTEELTAELSSLLEAKSLMPTATLDDEVTLSVQDQLKMATNRIKQSIELIDPQSPKQVHYVENALSLEHKIQTLLKPEAFSNTALMQKLSLTPSDMEVLGDMKGVLTGLSEQLSTMNVKSGETLELVNKLITQIEYHQLLSYVSSSNHLYIPLAWQGLKEGSMMMKQTQEDNFHCQIDLDLEHYGKINMMLVLSQQNYIDVSIATQKNELKEKVFSNLQELKLAFNEVGLITGSVKLIEYKEKGFAKQQSYASGESMSNFGINIKI